MTALRFKDLPLPTTGQAGFGFRNSVEVSFVIEARDVDMFPVLTPGALPVLARTINEHGASIEDLAADGVSSMTPYEVTTRVRTVVTVSQIAYKAKTGRTDQRTTTDADLDADGRRRPAQHTARV